MSTILLHMVWPWCEFRMQVWSVLHAARWKCRTQKIAINPPSGHHRTNTIGKKNFLNNNISSTYSHNMVNFGLLGAEIVC